MSPVIQNIGLVALIIIVQLSNHQGTSSPLITGSQGSVTAGQRNATTETTRTLETSREEKFLSIFSIVRFPNSVCTGTNSYNGTCLTSVECSSYGGSGSGTCASGFGVCCIVVFQTCGSSTSLNTTYWQNPGFASAYTTAGQCSFSISRYSSDIRQLRLDFYSLQLAAPEATTTTALGQCSTDSFTVIGSANSVPAICGNNTNQHIYVNYGPGTTTLTFNIITTGGSTSRYWSIGFAQIPGFQTYTAPDNCLQWYTDVSGTLKSFNFLSAATPTVQHLAYQDYTICIRTNQGFCGIGYAVCSTVYPSFGISGTSAAATAATTTVLDASCAYDWIQIPCASDQMNSILTIAATGCATKICGVFLTVAATGATSVPVYSYRRPFEVRFYTDSNEQITSSSTESFGFCLTYTQQPCLSFSSSG